MRGAGIYDDVCEAARIASGEPSLVLLLVVNGDRGTGFSVHGTTEETMRRVPFALRAMADEIERMEQS